MKGLKVLPEGCYEFITMDEKQFLKQCKTDTYAASGPGGQKRNRTYSAVRLTHIQTGISVIAEESRSQTENRTRALKRLRKTMALCLRKDPLTSGFRIPDSISSYLNGNAAGRMNSRNVLYPLFCATILDAIFYARGSMGIAGETLGVSTGQLSRIISRDPGLFHAANIIREYFQCRPLRRQDRG